MNKVVARYIGEEIARLSETLCLDEWKIRYSFADLSDESGETETVFGMCLPSAQISEASVAFDPKAMLDNGEDLDQIIAHEVSHIATSPMRQAAQVATTFLEGKTAERLADEYLGLADERTVTYLTKMLLKTHPKNKEGNGAL